MSLKNIEYNWATFFKHYIVCPEDAPSKEQRKMARIASVVIGILTLGIAHLVAATNFKKYRFTIRDRNDRTLERLYIEHDATQGLIAKRAEKGDRVAAFKMYDRLKEPLTEGTPLHDLRSEPWYKWLNQSSQHDYGPAIAAMIKVMGLSGGLDRKTLKRQEKALRHHPAALRKLGVEFLETDVAYGVHLLKSAARCGDRTASGILGAHYEGEAAKTTEDDERERLINIALEWYADGVQNVATLEHIIRILNSGDDPIATTLWEKFRELADEGNSTFDAILHNRALTEIDSLSPDEENPHWDRLSTLVDEGHLLASYFITQECIRLNVPEQVEAFIGPLLEEAQTDLCVKVIDLLHSAKHEKEVEILKGLIAKNPFEGEYHHRMVAAYYQRWCDSENEDDKLRYAEKATRYALHAVKLPSSEETFDTNVKRIGELWQEHPNLLQYFTEKQDLKLWKRIASTREGFAGSLDLITGVLGLKYAESKNPEKQERARLYLEQGLKVGGGENTTPWLDEFRLKLGSLPDPS